MTYTVSDGALNSTQTKPKPNMASHKLIYLVLMLEQVFVIQFLADSAVSATDT